MPAILHQLDLISSITDVPSTQAANMPIGIIGTAASGTDNQLIKITTAADLAQFGSDVDNASLTLLKDIKILRRYGCSNIYAVKVATGVDAAATITNIIGSDVGGVKTGLELFRDMRSIFGIFPRWILIPGANTADVLTKAVTVAKAVRAFVAADFPSGTSAASAITIRSGATGLGVKDRVLYPCLPHVKNGATLENLSTHLVGLSAWTAYIKGFGFTPSNKTLLGVDGIEAGFTLSYIDDTADNQLLERAGCVTVNINLTDYVLWGNRNGLYFNATETDWDTYQTLNRIEQELNEIFSIISARFIDQVSNYATAYLLESALNSAILDNLIPGCYSAESRATLDMSTTDFKNRVLGYRTVVKSYMPTEQIILNTVYTVAI